MSVGFLILWYHFAPQTVQQKLAQTAKPVAKVEGQISAPAVKAESVPVKPAPLPKSPSVKSAPEAERIIELPSARVVIGSRGAGVRHWWLKENGGTSASSHSVAQWPDLVNHAARSADAELLPPEKWPLSTYPDLNFESTPVEAIAGGGIQSVWKAVLPNGIELEKKFVWIPEQNGNTPQFPKVALTFRNPRKQGLRLDEFKIGWSQGLGTIESEKKENPNNTRVIAYPSPKKAVDKLENGSHKMDYKWVAVDNRYYLFAMIPVQGQFDHIEAAKDKLNQGEVIMAALPSVIKPGQQHVLELPFYIGPKGYTHLKKWNMGLEHAVDFGYFAFLGKWALKALYALHNVSKNYGWSIILLTMILQVLLLPLSIKSYKSMAGMKRIQPKIQEMQKRFKDDSKRMNEEMLKLYRESGTNPFGGCLPMIVQIPVFWAFYTMLRGAYELRGAPWIFWIKDLSQHDPFYILPIVMGAGMLLQQKISGPPGDPAQAKIMMLMPVMFTFMFLNFPSGMVLYWLTNSTLSIIVQYGCNRKFSVATAVA